ncbi:hypothetical protein [Anaerocolumna chitinilytica]|uniref:Uncharacterized protein n=1 Tax=Anaerocolumna chitinilytica TaxID=1727145 RepID=A0A7I8DL67_9FIRM|nr:hypothetical protein [Anaerocolumna chitinilytica]BCJ98467.1 hypothetical protein bsdcttw_15080 [Anaerocolumna chitinilytica]
MDNLPILYVSFINYKDNTISIPVYYYTWIIKNTDGTTTQITGENFLHPLDKVNSLPEIQIPYSNNSILLTFSTSPTNYTVQYWIYSKSDYNDCYKVHDNYIPISDNHLLFLPNLSDNYVIQVNANWPQGHISYDFFVSYY